MRFTSRGGALHRRLRILLGAAIAAAVLVVALPSAGQAIPVYLWDMDDAPQDQEHVVLHGGSYSIWGRVENHDFDGCVADSNTFNMLDGSFWQGSPDTGTSYTDAFDSALQFLVGQTEFVDSDNIVDKKGEQVTAGPEMLEGLRTSVVYKALPEKPVVRVLFKMTNPGSTAEDRTIVFDNNLGSDADTDVRDTSSGDAAQQPGDRWVVSSEYSTTPPFAPDPVLTWSLYGKGPVREKVDDVICEPGVAAPNETYPDHLTVDFEVRIPAAKTLYLLMFVRQTATNAQGSTAAADFDQEKAYLFKGLSPEVRDRILNWDL